MSKRHPVTRREFVKSAAAAAAVFAAGGAPTIISPNAFADDPKPAPSERLSVGFIGLGKQHQGHMNDMFSKKGVQVVAVCDVDGVRREHFKGYVDSKYAEFERKDTKGCAAYADYRELLARPDIDAVFIVTPDHWHTAIAMEACKQKKDVYCEKPLTLTIDEAHKLIEVVRKYDRVFQVGSQQRSEGPFRDVCDYIRSGRLGKIKEVYVGVGATSKPCDLPAEEPDPGLNWDMWLGQAPQRPYNQILCRKGLPDSYPFNPGWRDYREFSGGFITDWGAHHFDIVQWALDKDGSGPDEIRPPEKEGDDYGVKLIYKDSTVGDNIVVTHKKTVFEYDAAGKDGKVEHRVMTNGILFIGEKGKIFVDRSVKVSEPASILEEPLKDGDKKLFASPGHRQNWLDCIKSRQRPLCDVAVGAGSVTVCHLVNLAYWNHKKLQWDPKKWEFIGDNAEEANKWRSRERRAPYALPIV